LLDNYTPEMAVAEWEAKCNSGEKIKPRKVRTTIRNIAEINISEKRGITVNDIHFKTNRDDKRGIIFRLLTKKVLTALPSREGRLKQYVLSNLYNEFDTLKQSATLNKKKNIQELEFDYGIIDRVAEYFSREKPNLHNIHIQTNIDKEDYQFLSKDWNINIKNKSKTKEFALGPKRRCGFTVYPNGTVLITISCSFQPFKMHMDSELIEFFSILGEIRKTFAIELSNSSTIPSVNEWKLTQYDVDNTLAIKDLQKEFSSQLNVSSSLRNSIPIRLLGHLFYCYIKPMPNQGDSIRFEERIFPDKKPLSNGIKDVLESVPPFKKAMDMKKNATRIDKEIIS
jgi:hypothetical protein